MKKGVIIVLKWKRLDLRKKEASPNPGELVALRMSPSNGHAKFYSSERYDIGCFKTDERSTSKKPWWHGCRGTDDPTRLKKHYDIWWCPVAEFDGF